MKKILVLSLVIVALVLAGCKTGGTKADDSKPVAKKEKKAKKKKGASGNGTIYYMIDRNIKPDQREDKANAQRQVGDWMERDLGKIIKKRLKYSAVAIKKSSGFKAGKNNYLLKVKIIKYNPGSYAARSFIGFGAGAASMDITYELKNSAGKRVLKNSDGVGSGRDWRRVARKLNENMAREMKIEIY
jgi:hypothetical protein